MDSAPHEEKHEPSNSLESSSTEKHDPIARTTPNSPVVQILSAADLIHRSKSLDEEINSSETPRYITTVDLSSDVPAAATSTPLNTTMDTAGKSEAAIEVAHLEQQLAFDSDEEGYLERHLRERNQVEVLLDEQNLQDLLFHLNENPNFDSDDDGGSVFDFPTEYPAGHLPQPLYPMGPLKYKECIVCLEMKDLNMRTCCAAAVCDDCVLMYVTVQIQGGNVKIGCPNDNCDKYVHRDEVMTRLSGDLKEKYNRFLVDANREPHVKTCPRCSTITKVDPSQLKNPKVKKKGLRKTCPVCELDWCFPCQSPWHEAISCKVFHKGDKLLKKWAKEHNSGQANAQRCPKCKFFIQRSSGCDHMTCSKCHVNFCYKCGERHIKVKFFGDHYSRLSVFGCKYRFLPNNPIKRKLARGSIFALKTLMLPVVAVAAVAVGAFVIGAGIFILPVWGGLRIRDHVRREKRRKEDKVFREMWRKKLHDIRITGDPYIENFNRMRDLGQDPFALRGRNGVLVVDELDMRQAMSSSGGPAQLYDPERVVSSDDASTTSANVHEAPSVIKLCSDHLDIHAALEPHSELDGGQEPMMEGAECQSVASLCDEVESDFTEIGNGDKSERKDGELRESSSLSPRESRIKKARKVLKERRRKLERHDLKSSDFSFAETQNESNYDLKKSSAESSDQRKVTTETSCKNDRANAKRFSLRRRADSKIEKSDSSEGSEVESGFSDESKNSESPPSTILKGKKESSSTSSGKDPRMFLKTGAKLVSQYTMSCGLKSESNDDEGERTEEAGEVIIPNPVFHEPNPQASTTPDFGSIPSNGSNNNSNSVSSEAIYSVDRRL